MEHLGDELKRAREAAGLSMGDVAARTKIAIVALEALERNDFGRLPGGIFGRSIVRAYAMEVGADPEAAVGRFIERLEQHEREAAEQRAAKRSKISDDDREFLERQRRAMLLLRVGLVVLVLAVAALVTWFVRAGRTAAETPPTASPIEAPAIVDSPPPPVDPEPEPEPVLEMESEPVSVPANVRQADAAPMVIEFDVSGDSWISVSIDGAPSAARLFRAGDHQRLEVAREVLLDVGNAGGFRLVIDGKPAKPLGREGSHVRTRITRQNIGEFLE